MPAIIRPISTAPDAHVAWQWTTGGFDNLSKSDHTIAIHAINDAAIGGVTAPSDYTETARLFLAANRRSWTGQQTLAGRRSGSPTASCLATTEGPT